MIVTKKSTISTYNSKKYILTKSYQYPTIFSQGKVNGIFEEFMNQSHQFVIFLNKSFSIANVIFPGYNIFKRDHDVTIILKSRSTGVLFAYKNILVAQEIPSSIGEDKH